MAFGLAIPLRRPKAMWSVEAEPWSLEGGRHVVEGRRPHPDVTHNNENCQDVRGLTWEKDVSGFRMGGVEDCGSLGESFEGGRSSQRVALTTPGG